MNLKVSILFENNHLLVVDKPAGVIVNRAETTVNRETLQDWVEKYTSNTLLDRSGIVHRLDKDTSGVMLVAKNTQTLTYLLSQFKQRLIQKEYLALVHGKLIPKEGTINLPIGRSTANRHKFKVDIFGKKALTSYQVTTITPNHCSLVRCFPKTGRTHQIRVHLTHVGHPIVADELYGSRKQLIKDQTWCPRHFLHAAKISFYYSDHKLYTFISPLPPDLNKALALCSNSI